MDALVIDLPSCQEFSLMSKSIQEMGLILMALYLPHVEQFYFIPEGNLLRKIFIPHWKIFVAFISPLLARILRFQFTNVIRLQNHGIIYAFFDKSLFIINSSARYPRD